MKKSALSRLIFPLDRLLEAPEHYYTQASVFSKDNVSSSLEEIGQVNQLLQKFTEILEKVPEEIFQDRCLGNNPKLNFKTIVQSRLSGNSWKSLAQKFRVSESRLRIFWYRSVKELTPKLKPYLSDAVEQINS